MNTRFRKELVAYLLVGALGAVVDFGVFFLLTTNNVPLAFAQWIAAFLGFSHNHLWQHFAIFNHNQRLARTYTLSTAAALVGVAVSAPALAALNAVLQHTILSKVLILILNATALFIVRKQWIFTRAASSPLHNPTS